MRLTAVAATVALLALPLHVAPALAAPTEDWSARIGAEGLRATGAALAALAAPTPDDLLAHGVVQFLAGIEAALHLRWTVGATDPLAPVPVLRLALPPNPAPEPYRDALVSEVFSGLLAQMQAANATLSGIGDGDDIGLVIRPEDLWLDIDGDGTRSGAEALLPLAQAALLNPWDVPATGTPATAPKIRFDTADAAWLMAYAHLLSALSEMALGYDPTAATARVRAAGADKRDRLGTTPSGLDGLVGADGTLDKAMIAILALRQTPDAARLRGAKGNLLEMVAQNRRFWTLAALETDNDREWIPNASQTGAFGITLAADVGPAWLAVLADLDAMLRGQLLVPHWALPPGSGVDLGQMLDNPAPIDILGWIHGINALPFARKGAVIGGDRWRTFESLVGGNSLLYAFYFN